MALGLCMCLLGGEAMIIDRVVLADHSSDLAQRSLNSSSLDYSSPYAAYNDPAAYNAGFSLPGNRVWIPPEWAPWGLMSAGVLTFLYANALPKSSEEE